MDKQRVKDGKKPNLLDKAHDIQAGLVYNFKTSRGFQWHLVADTVFVTLGLSLTIGASNIIVLLILAAAKASMECSNSAQESTADKVWGKLKNTGYRQDVADVKHSAAASEGIWVLLSLAIWAWFFVPEVWNLITWIPTAS